MTKGTFTSARIAVLKWLCAQAAISIENAQLYKAQERYSRELEVKVSQRTQQLQLSQSLLSGVLNSSIDGVMAFKSVRDSQGKIIDFEWLFVNLAAEAIIGRDRNSLIGKYLLPEMPGNRKEGLFDLYVQVVETNQLQEREIYYKHEGIEAWFQIVAVKLDDGIAVTFRNITERKQAEVAIQKANQALQRLATIDGLTQVANRRYFDEFFSLEWLRLTRENAPLSLLVCDVDHFKCYNDTCGHQAGDECLRSVASAISCAVKRPADLVARYGGEEFVVILPNTDELGAVTVAQAIAQELQQAKIIHFQSAVSQYVTLSIGIASTIPTQEYSPEVLFAVADKALYEAKQGRNCAAKNLLPAYKFLAALINEHHNVAFLISMTAIAFIMLRVICYSPPRLSYLGHKYLQQLQDVFDQFNHKSKNGIPPLRSEYDLLVALFGVNALIGTPYDSYRKMFISSRSSYTTSSSGGCGSSCSSGCGSSCGSGCGGCGGCGG